jgi:hypothetical protein
MCLSNQTKNDEKYVELTVKEARNLIKADVYVKKFTVYYLVQLLCIERTPKKRPVFRVILKKGDHTFFYSDKIYRRR